MRWMWIITTFLFIGLISPPAMAAEEVNVGYLTVSMSLPTFVAIEKGFFGEEGLIVKPTPFVSGTLIMDALVAGRIDVNAGNASVAHWMVETNMPGIYKIFLIYATENEKDNTFPIIVKKDSPYQSFSDLKGKKVGTFPGITSLALSKAIFRKFLDPEKEIIFIEIPPQNIVEALAAGQVDAVFTPEPFGIIGVSKGIARYLVKSPHQLLNLKKGVLGGVFSFNTKFIQSRPQVARKVKTVYDRSVDFIRKNEPEARKYLAKYANMPDPVALQIPLEKWFKIGEFDQTMGQPYFDVLMKEGLFQRYVDTSQLFYKE